jgi:DNA-binding PadR family transcriptional regulator
LATTDLKPFSYAVLTLIGEGGAAPHDLVEMVRTGGPLFWSAAPSQIYAEPKRLERLGYLRSRKAPGRTHERTVYMLTASGRRALLDWLSQPSPFPRIQHEASVRVMAGDMAGDDGLLASVRGMRPELERLRRLVDEMEAHAEQVPHRVRYLRLNYSLARRMIAAHEAWVDEVERALG